MSSGTAKTEQPAYDGVEVVRVYCHSMHGVGHAMVQGRGTPLCGVLTSFSIDSAPFDKQDCKNCWRVLRSQGKP